ncbi:hypothetical protein CRE_29185 [Caenorhabditis remanei]|uniref:Uncharacterized protein n=1 Tax=Caenorhabditis remanei TaxID=31234 RepID=E3ND48_CAERE|nr:hypothetical protein CRE_29185 [Caenorhabditis remanei]
MVTRFTAVVLKEHHGYTLMYSKKFKEQLLAMEGSAGPQKPRSGTSNWPQSNQGSRRSTSRAAAMRGQREWTLEKSGAGGLMAIKVQVALDGLLMIGGTRFDRRVRDPVSKAQQEKGEIIGRNEIQYMEQTRLDRILMSTYPYLFNYGDGEDEIEDEEEIESILDDLEIIALDEFDD